MDHQFEIVTDSTCDLTVEELAELGVKMVPLHVFVGDGCYLDQIEIKPKEFYAKMAPAEGAAAQLPSRPLGLCHCLCEACGGGRQAGPVHPHLRRAFRNRDIGALAAQDSPVPVCVRDTKIGTSM